MPTKRYKGSCHCGKVKYEVDIDLSTGTGRCNCTYCAKVRNWSVGVKPGAFTLLSGEDNLGDYNFRTDSTNHHHFCKTCGVRVFGRGYVKEIGGDYVSIPVTTLDGVEPRELIEAPLRYMDGLHDNWFSTPVETRHL